MSAVVEWRWCEKHQVAYLAACEGCIFERTMVAVAHVLNAKVAEEARRSAKARWN